MLKYMFSTACSCSLKPFTPDIAMPRVNTACCSSGALVVIALSERRAAESILICRVICVPGLGIWAELRLSKRI